MKEENLNHYGVMAQRGLSNALSRTFSEDPSVNATLFCVNQVSKGVLKRGHVGVSLQRFDDTLKVGAVSLLAPAPARRRLATRNSQVIPYFH